MATTDKLLKLSQVGIIKQDSDNSYLGKTANAASASKLNNSEAIGSATQPVYFNADGVPVATTNSLEKSVPSDALFTDTTYDEATQSKSGLVSAADKKKLDGISNGAQVNVIEKVTVGGTEQTPTDKAVALGSAAGASIENTLTDGANLPTGAAVKAYVEGLGFQTSNDVAAAIANSGHLAKEVATAIPSAAKAKDDVLYYVMNSASGYYDIYQKIGNDVVRLDDVSIDLSGYVQTGDIVYATDDEVRAALGQNS